MALNFPILQIDNKEKEKEKANAIMLIQFVYLSLSIVGFIKGFDHLHDVYLSGVYNPSNRGRAFKDASHTVPSNHTGIFYSHHNTFGFDGTTASPQSPIQRSLDNNKRKERQEWTGISTQALVHPFAASVSGTDLLILNICIYLATLPPESHPKIKSFAENKKALKDVVLGSIVAMLHLLGGHSLFEYFYPFGMEEVQKKFPESTGMIDMLKKFNLENILLVEYKEIYEKTLAETVKFYSAVRRSEEILNDIKKNANALKRFMILKSKQKKKEEQKEKNKLAGNYSFLLGHKLEKFKRNAANKTSPTTQLMIEMVDLCVSSCLNDDEPLKTPASNNFFANNNFLSKIQSSIQHNQALRIDDQFKQRHASNLSDEKIYSYSAPDMELNIKVTSFIAKDNLLFSSGLIITIENQIVKGSYFIAQKDPIQNLTLKKIMDLLAKMPAEELKNQAIQLPPLG